MKRTVTEAALVALSIAVALRVILYITDSHGSPPGTVVVSVWDGIGQISRKGLVRMSPFFAFRILLVTTLDVILSGGRVAAVTFLLGIALAILLPQIWEYDFPRSWNPYIPQRRNPSRPRSRSTSVVRGSEPNLTQTSDSESQTPKDPAPKPQLLEVNTSISVPTGLLVDTADTNTGCSPGSTVDRCVWTDDIDLTPTPTPTPTTPTSNPVQARDEHEDEYNTELELESVLSDHSVGSRLRSAETFRQEARSLLHTRPDVRTGAAGAGATSGDGDSLRRIEEKVDELYRKAGRRFFIANNPDPSLAVLSLHNLTLKDARGIIKREVLARRARGEPLLDIIVPDINMKWGVELQLQKYGLQTEVIDPYTIRILLS